MSVPSWELGPPTSYPASECVSPHRTQVEGDTLACWGGAGGGGPNSPIQTTGQKLWYSIYSIIPLHRVRSCDCLRLSVQILRKLSHNYAQQAFFLAPSSSSMARLTRLTGLTRLDWLSSRASSRPTNLFNNGTSFYFYNVLRKWWLLLWCLYRLVSKKSQPTMLPSAAIVYKCLRTRQVQVACFR